MLISFSVRNFRTFREKVEWSLIASPDKTREDDNVVDLPAFGLRLLKSAVVYGANASGKSKLVDAIEYMVEFVLSSSISGQIGNPTGVEPFKLNPDSAHSPSEFEIQFIYNDELYRYGFELSATQIKAEWLYLRTARGMRKKPEIELFYRTEQNIIFHPRQFAGIVNELVKNSAVRDNALLVSVAAQFNHPRAIILRQWFSKIIFLGKTNEYPEKLLTLIGLRNPMIKKDILDFLQNVGLDIKDINESSQPMLSFKKEDKSPEFGLLAQQWLAQEHAELKTSHLAYDGMRKPSEPVEFSVTKDESTGTQKLLMLTGPMLSTLTLGQILIADELDARLHPNLVSKIVQLFNSKTTNPNNAQLLFNTHDTNLLTSGNFRRDQIWFTEKNRYGEATLYSLADFKTDTVRKGDNLEANYVRGKYGAVPYLGNFNALPKPDATPESAANHE